MRHRRPSSALLIALTLLLVLPATGLTLVAQDPEVTTATLLTDKDTYRVGETVTFQGEHYDPPGTSYELNVTLNSVVHGHLTFDSNDTAHMPEGTSWLVPAGIPSGVYTATVYNTTDPANAETYKQEVATTTFSISAGTLASDKEEYFVDEVVQFSGTGYTPNGTEYYIEISLGGAAIATVPFISESDGSIPSGTSWPIPFDAANGTYVATSYNSTEPSVGVSLAFTSFFVNATEAGMIGAVTQEIEGLVDLIESSVETVNVSLIAKLNAVDKKVDQAIAWLAENRTKVAINMLQAAKNVLNAFMNHVQAQRGKHIDEETADQLIQEAEAILAKIDRAMSSIGSSSSQAQVQSGNLQTPGQQASASGGSEGNKGGNGKGKGKGKGPK